MGPEKQAVTDEFIEYFYQADTPARQDPSGGPEKQHGGHDGGHHGGHDQAEPVILPKKDRPKARNARERRAEAVQLYNSGHLTNPAGRPKRKGAELVPSRAKPIGEDGNVTVPQLWAAYLKLFSDSFGLEILPTIMASTKENVTKFFDQMRQKFIEVNQHDPSNRELWQYLKWFHEPKRLAGLMKAGKYSGNLGYVPPQQVLGSVHISQFYSTVLKAKKQDGFASEGALKARETTEFFRQAISRLNEAWGDSAAMFLLLLNYGYVITAEWMKDYKDLSPDECARHIIRIMADSHARVENKQASEAAMIKIWQATEKNFNITSTVWDDWRAACAPFAKAAVAESGSAPK